MERDDWYFGVDMGVYYNPDEPAVITRWIFGSGSQNRTIPAKGED
jgi:hypothetical protein